MTNVSVPTPEEAFVERVRAARQSGAVLKAKLITIRSDLPNALILALEGDDDKTVYGQWIRRLRPGLRYEPFPCGGKKEVRALKASLDRDLNGLAANVFMLVDRDFDDLAGFGPSETVFMTEMYSVENYLVSAEVLDELLRDEFPCHARPDVRQKIIEQFDYDYQSFLDVTKEVNRRIFVARRTNSELKRRLPTSLRYLANVSIGAVTASGVEACEVVMYDKEPAAEEVMHLQDAFEALDQRTRYRGKFAFKFFREWLNQLADDHSSEASIFFDGIDGAVRRAEFVLSNFASKSRMPSGLQGFLEALG